MGGGVMVHWWQVAGGLVGEWCDAAAGWCGVGVAGALMAWGWVVGGLAGGGGGDGLVVQRGVCGGSAVCCRWVVLYLFPRRWCVLDIWMGFQWMVSGMSMGWWWCSGIPSVGGSTTVNRWWAGGVSVVAMELCAYRRWLVSDVSRLGGSLVVDGFKMGSW